MKAWLTHSILTVFLVSAFFLAAPSARAETALPNDFAFGAHLGLGGIISNDFDLAIQPMVMYTPWKNIGLFFRFGWERVLTGPLKFNIFPLLVGGRVYYSIPKIEKVMKPYHGLGIGVAIGQGDDIGGTHARFAFNFQSGMEFEVYKHLGFDLSFDTLVPVQEGVTLARFSAFLGLLYYIPL